MKQKNKKRLKKGLIVTAIISVTGIIYYHLCKNGDKILNNISIILGKDEKSKSNIVEPYKKRPQSNIEKMGFSKNNYYNKK